MLTEAAPRLNRNRSRERKKVVIPHRLRRIAHCLFKWLAKRLREQQG